MQLQSILLAVISATAVSAHFSISYPYWRGDSFPTQWTYPCGGVNQTISANNRTLWPLDGGPLVFAPSHDFAQTYVNLGIGNEVTRLNITLVHPFNQTGNGTFCFPHLSLPKGLEITEGTNASVQVIQITQTGGALYNCADITFSSKAVSTLASGVCVNSTGVGAAPFTYNGDSGSTTDNGGSGSAATCNSTSGNGASSDTKTGGAGNLKISVLSVGAIALAVASMMM